MVARRRGLYNAAPPRRASAPASGAFAPRESRLSARVSCPVSAPTGGAERLADLGYGHGAAQHAVGVHGDHPAESPKRLAA